MPAEGAVRNGNQAGFELIETLRWEPRQGFCGSTDICSGSTLRRRRWASADRGDDREALRERGASASRCGCG